MARLYRLTEIRPWKNDSGESRAAGLETNDRNCLEVNSSDTALVDDLLGLSYPCTLEIDVEPSPDDPMRNVVVAFKLLDAK